MAKKKRGGGRVESWGCNLEKPWDRGRSFGTNIPPQDHCVTLGVTLGEGLDLSESLFPLLLLYTGNQIWLLQRIKRASWLFWWLSGKESSCNAGDPGSIPGLERFPGEGNGHPLQYSCLENPMDGRAWKYIESAWYGAWLMLSAQQRDVIRFHKSENCFHSVGGTFRST